MHALLLVLVFRIFSVCSHHFWLLIFIFLLVHSAEWRELIAKHGFGSQRCKTMNKSAYFVERTKRIVMIYHHFCKLFFFLLELSTARTPLRSSFSLEMLQQKFWERTSKKIAGRKRQRHTYIKNERKKRKSERQTSVSSWAHFVWNQVNEKH